MEAHGRISYDVTGVRYFSDKNKLGVKFMSTPTNKSLLNA